MSVDKTVDVKAIRDHIWDIQESLETIEEYGYAADNPETRVLTETVYKNALDYIERANIAFEKLCGIARDNFEN